MQKRNTLGTLESLMRKIQENHGQSLRKLSTGIESQIFNPNLNLMMVLPPMKKTYIYISESFINVFLNIGPTLAKSIPCINKSPLGSMGDMIMESMSSQPVACNEISKLLVDMKNTACGWDDIGAMFLKLSPPVYHTATCFICNQSLTEGVFPNQLKLANVIPLYKADNPMLFNHYRPVSLYQRSLRK